MENYGVEFSERFYLFVIISGDFCRAVMQFGKQDAAI